MTYPDRPIHMVSPTTLAQMQAFSLPTYREQCNALEMIRYKMRQAEKRYLESLFPKESWGTAFQTSNESGPALLNHYRNRYGDDWPSSR